MKKLILITSFILLSIGINAQAVVDWSNYPGGVSLALDARNNVYTVNWEYNPGGDITITKRNAQGDSLWSRTYNNTDNTRHEVASWVATDNQYNVIVCGTIRSGYSNPVNAASLVMKYDSSGNLLWRQVYENSFDGSSTRKCIVDAGRNIYVLGLGTGPSGQVTKIKKFSPSGTALWSYFDANGIGAPLNIKFTPDNNILITGKSVTGSFMGYSKINKSGQLIWSLNAVQSLTAGDASGDAFGNTYIVHGTYPNTSFSTLRKLNPAGNLIWQNSTLPLTAYRVETGNDNRPVLCGFPNTGSGGSSFLKTDTSGNVLWANPDADGPSVNLLLHAQLLLDVYNNAYLAAGTLTGMGVCKVNSNGSSGWTIVTPGSYSNAIALGSDHAVYVTGGQTARIAQPVPCEPPPVNSTSQITPSGARLNWLQVPGADQYEIWWKKATAVNWRKRFTGAASKNVSLQNLTCNTSYVWQIRTVCDSAGPDIVSAFGSLQTFTTGACISPRIADEDENLSLWPNPAHDYFNINWTEADPARLQMYNLMGQVVLERTIYSGTTTLERGHLAAGTYLVRVISEAGMQTQLMQIE